MFKHVNGKKENTLTFSYSWELKNKKKIEVTKSFYSWDKMNINKHRRKLPMMKSHKITSPIWSK